MKYTQQDYLIRQRIKFIKIKILKKSVEERNGCVKNQFHYTSDL